MKNWLLKLFLKSLVLWRKTNHIWDNRPAIACIGDSWFNLTYLNPVYIDILDYLRKFFKITDGAFPGYTLIKELRFQVWKTAASKHKKQLFLISLSGNDYIFLHFKMMYDPITKAPDLHGIKTAVRLVTTQLRAYFAQILEAYPESHIVTHGYDYTFPAWSSKLFAGTLHHHKGLTDAQIKAISDVLIQEHNNACELIFSGNERVHFIRLTDTLIPPEDYTDDIHPSWTGARKLGMKIKWAIEDLVPSTYWS